MKVIICWVWCMSEFTIIQLMAHVGSFFKLVASMTWGRTQGLVVLGGQGQAGFV